MARFREVSVVAGSEEEGEEEEGEGVGEVDEGEVRGGEEEELVIPTCVRTVDKRVKDGEAKGKAGIKDKVDSTAVLLMLLPL